MKSRKRLLKILATLGILVVAALLFGWYKFFREVDQPEWITADAEKNFLYGSIGSESQAGIPYWIVVVLPRIFGDQYMPGPGGYASLGLPWEEGREFPTGFSKKTIGFDRVAFNCALCHSTRYRLEENDTPTIVAAGGSNTADIQGLLDFFSKSASDPRFNADTILTEIDLAYRLSWLDRLLYKFLYIPMTRKQLIAQGNDFAWSASRPRWGPGRDAPMNLTKFNFLKLPDDGSVDNTDFPSIWHLEVRVQPGRVWPEEDYALDADFHKLKIDQSKLMLMNLAGDTTSFRSVLIDSALGLQAKNTPFFHRRMKDLEAWLRALPPPAYPLPTDSSLVAQGKAIFEARCADCHAPGQANRMGTTIPVEELGTDPERTNAWTREAANAANQKVREIGVERTPMSKPDRAGYTALQLDGLWLRGPYLHNGSVPTVAALLERAACRPKVFYRGYDVLDRDNIGFVAQRCDAEPVSAPDGCTTIVSQRCMPPDKGWRYDTSERGNDNGGHEYGSDLGGDDKRALIEYLKTI